MPPEVDMPTVLVHFPDRMSHSRTDLSLSELEMEARTSELVGFHSMAVT